MPPVTLKNADGQTIHVDAEDVGFYRARGWEPQSQEQAYQEFKAEKFVEDPGLLGTIGATATSALSGVTLGLSDVAIGALASERRKKEILEDRAALPVLAGAANVAGAILPALAAPGTLLARTPAGAVGRFAAEGYEAGRALGGVAGTARAAGAAGLEGAAQSAGAYLGNVALGDRELSAEGLAAAAGAGFGLGATAGGVLLGVERGTIAARRLFSRPANAERAVKAAELDWDRASTEALEASDSAASAARAQLDEARAMRQRAQLAADRAAADEAAIRARPTAVSQVSDDLESTLAPALNEYDVARAEFESMRKRIVAGEIGGEMGPFTDKGLDLAAFRGLTRPGAVDDLAVPVGEFGAPGRRGFKTPQQLALGTDANGLAGSLDRAGVPASDVTQALRKSAGTPPEGADDLEALLRGTQDQLAAGKGLKEMGAPARADYVATKAAKTKEAAEHFRAEALAKRNEATPSTPFSDEEYKAYKTAYGHAADAHMPSEMSYSKGGDEIVNPALRSGKPLDGEAAVLRDGLDAAFREPESRIPRDATLYRGLSDNAMLGQRGVKARFADVKPGDVLEDPAYTSTTYSAKAKSRNEDVVFTIHAPAGTPALPLRTHYTFEGELLLPRGTKFRVDSIEHVPVTDRWDASGLRSHEVLPDKSVRMVHSDGSVSVQAPIKDIRVTIIDAPAGPVAAARAPRVGLDAPVDKLSLRQLGEYQEALNAAFDKTPRGTPEYERLSEMWDEAAARRNAISDRKIADVSEYRGSSDIALAQVAARPGAVEDIAAIAPVITRLEKASAELVDALADTAPIKAVEVTKMFRKAESEADRKALDRTTRAIDDAAEVPVDDLAAARARKLDARAQLAQAKAAETEARLGADAAKRTAAETRKAAETIGVPPVPEAPPKGFGLAEGLGAVELANTMGQSIPGMPSVRDIPLIGPLLGAYLQFRTVKAAAGRFAGRVPATGETRAAALATRTKDRIADAVDRSLGVVATSAPKARRVATAVLVRAFDDGEPDAPADASLQKQAAVRIREVHAAASRPDLVIAQVRREMRDVHDPDLIAAAEKHRVRSFQWLSDQAPKAPPPNPYTKREWEPSPAAAAKFARQYEAVFDPVSVFEALAQQSLSLDAAEALRATSPKLFAMAQERLVSRAQDLDHPVPYQQRLRASKLFDVPLDPSLEPGALAILQTGFQREQPQPQAPAPGTAPSINSLYQTGLDRRAMR